MHDTTRLARQGIPTATIVWDTFAVPAKTHARILGMPDLPMLVIPHLEPGETTADVRRRAEADAERIIELLTRGPEGTPPAASSGRGQC